MNPLNWFTFLSESRSEGDSFDTSLVLPLTVGLGTVVVSVLLGFRSNLLNNSNKKLKHDQSLPNSMRESVKRKPSKMTAKPKPNILPNGEIKPAPKPSTPVQETSSSENRTTPIVAPLATSSLPESFHSQFVPEQPNLLADTKATSDEPIVSLPTQHSTGEVPKLSIGRRKSKKTKRSHRTEESQGHLSVGISTETDPSWVTVIPKKSKHSTGPSPADVSPTTATQPSSEAANTSIQIGTEAPASPSSVTDVPCPSQSDPLSTLRTATHPSAADSVSSRTTQPVTSTEHPSDSSTVQHSTPQCATASGRVASASDRRCEPSNPKCETLRSTTLIDLVTPSPPAQETGVGELAASHSQTLHSAVTDTPLTLKPLALFAHLPATSQLLAQHLSAQVQAKEAECQLLRSEVIYLREQVEHVLNASRSCCVDAVTMTDLSEPEASPTSSASDPSEPATPGDHEHRSDSSDAVLLRTLQNEIARLAKEVTLSHQRNENLESRLETTKSQLAVAKKKTSRDTKAIRQQLEAETERATKAEQAMHEMETKLQETQQQLATQRQQIEESELSLSQQLERVRLNYTDLLAQKERWEQQQTTLQSEKDRLTREYECMRTKHSACLVDLESARYESKKLRTMLRDAESRLGTVERDHAAALIESQTHVTQLQTQLDTVQEKQLETQTKLSAAESSIVRLTLDLDASLTRLASVTEELDASRVACLALEKRLHDNHDNQQRVRRNEAEAMQTHPNSQTTPIMAEPRALFDETTQTDSEPAVEFELHPPDTEPSIVSTTASLSDEPDDKCKELEAQVAQYKSALDMAETMLSKLQTSVEEEEQRWRGALESSTVECGLLRSKIHKLESTLSGLIEERDQLNETLNELRHQRTAIPNNAESHSVEGRGSSVHSLSVARLADTVTYDENTPKPELIRLLNRFRYLVQVEHDALISEQANSAKLQAQLHNAPVDDGANCSVPRHTHSALNAPAKWPVNGPNKIVPAAAIELDDVSVDAAFPDATSTPSSNGRSHNDGNPKDLPISAASITPISNGLPQPP